MVRLWVYDFIHQSLNPDDHLYTHWYTSSRNFVSLWIYPGLCLFRLMVKRRIHLCVRAVCVCASCNMYKKRITHVDAVSC